MAEAPYEVVLGPAEVYVAPVATAFPAINAVPGAGWVLVGTAGDKNYTEDGVIIRRNVSSEMVRALGTTLARKVGITEVDFEVEFGVMDISPEEMLLAFGGDPDDVTDTAPGAGTAGHESFAMPTSPVPVHRAVLVRCEQSPFGDGFNTQIEIANAVQTGSGEGTFSKGDAFAQTHTWTAIEPSSGDAVVFRYQTDPPGE